ncbi:T9SS type A sorting domain-containing protein [bacterium]|nr:T9SS type A sorting domain-containing protein [bacterium]
MQKRAVFICILAFATAQVFASNFSPTVMTISAPEVINYNFDGKSIDIPITVSGPRGSAMFLVFTKDQASNINMIRNGFLGWHRVNKVDTCLYVSPLKDMDIGKNTITWTGKNQDGGTVPAGEYTYYLWGYDSVNPQQIVSRYLTTSSWKNDRIVTHNPVTGQQLVKPVIHGASGGGNGDELSLVTRQRWEIGGDPEDQTLLETTQIWSYYDTCKDVPSIYKDNEFFIFMSDNNLIGHIKKFAYVPNGESILDTKWANNGECVFSTVGSNGWWLVNRDMEYGGEGLMAATNTDISGSATMSELVFVDMAEGTEQFRIDLSEWWVSIESGEKGGQASQGPMFLDYKNNLMYLSTHCGCWKEVIDPHAGHDYEVDYMRWMNGNGDYVGDMNFMADSERPWVCNDYSSPPFMHKISADNNGFVSFGVSNLGAVTFGLMAPDGTGLGYFAFAGAPAKTAEDSGIAVFLTTGSAYDGFYCDNNIEGKEVDGKIPRINGTWYLAEDSFKGIITNAPTAVDENAPAAFTVKQNSPNPFNPSTTISFTIPEAGNVSVDVFNVAGQKIDTIASEFMSAGSHSITWNASGFSAGVYFYTVKSGEFSRTMKMTLLK